MLNQGLPPQAPLRGFDPHQDSNCSPQGDSSTGRNLPQDPILDRQRRPIPTNQTKSWNINTTVPHEVSSQLLHGVDDFDRVNPL